MESDKIDKNEKEKCDKLNVNNHAISLRIDFADNINVENLHRWNPQNFTELINTPRVNHIYYI